MTALGKSAFRISTDDSLSDQWNPTIAKNNDFPLDADNNVDDQGMTDFNIFSENSCDNFESNAQSSIQTDSSGMNVINISSVEETELVQYLDGSYSLEPSFCSQTTLTPKPTVHFQALGLDKNVTKVHRWEPDINDLCMSKNAVAARENRKRKKQYIQKLELSMSQLKTENCQLKKENVDMANTVEKLKTEVEYLKNIIANQSTLSRLIGQIHTTPGIKFQSSFTMQASQSVNKENFDENDNGKKNESVKNMVTMGKSKETCKRKAKSRHDVTLPISSTGVNEPSKQRMSTRSTNKMPKIHTSHSDVSAEKIIIDKEAVTKGEMIPRSETSRDHSSGVCLHVAGDCISLEFCASCAKSAFDAGIVAGDHCYGKSSES